MQSVVGRAGTSGSSRPVVWVIVVVAVLLAVAGAVQFARSQSPYRRFVSRPLPDGSRYTFLYPANLRVIQEGGGNPSPGVIANVNLQSSGPINAPPSPWDRLRRHMGVAVPFPGESVTVLVTPSKTRVAEDDRIHQRWVNATEVRHNETLRDARTQLQFAVYHACYTFAGGRPAALGQVSAHHPTLVRSFDVLPPGRGVPAP